MERQYLKSWYTKHKIRTPLSFASDITLPGWIADGTADRLAQAAYATNPPAQIGPYSLVLKSPTIKFYRAGNQIIVAVRGTKDARDVASWPLVATSQIPSGARFQEDARVLHDFKEDHPLDNFKYYGVGHSLAGCICDAFLRLGELEAAISYNPAVQIHDIHAGLPNTRIYHWNDPLYALMGRLVPSARVVRGSSQWWERLISKVPYIGMLYSAYSRLKSHELTNF
jgi:hypothetical protein